jgi:hypothetical protein
VALGIVTSPRAAALRDVLTTLARRFPGLPIILYPAPVQGAGAADEIAAAIAAANAHAEVDVLIVCRGGGSIEDLWAFNEEVLALAVFESRIPVISERSGTRPTSPYAISSPTRAPRRRRQPLRWRCRTAPRCAGRRRRSSPAGSMRSPARWSCACNASIWCRAA